MAKKIPNTQMTYEAFREQYHINLNTQQEAALRRVDGATLLLAVPGSGKTTVVISRTGYMILCAGIPAEHILTLTFSLAAAREMKERFQQKFGIMERMPYFATIHSFCVSVLRHCQRHYGNDVPALEPQNERIIRRVFQNVVHQYPTDSAVREIATAITLAKNSMMDAEEIKTTFDKLSCLSDVNVEFPALYEAYEEDKRENGLMDFDDQLLTAYSLLQQFPAALQFFQRQYTHIAVDEAQDTSKIQHAIIELLASRHNNIFMVGDDDQSIYGFRGASPTSLLQFEKTYPGAKVLYMETNYRSDASIVAQANQFIQDNHLRFRKKISSNTEKDGTIQTVAVFDVVDQYEKLYDLLKEGYGSKATTAVLYRNNDSALPVLEYLGKKGMSVRCRCEATIYFTNPIVSDLLAFLSFAVSGDSESFLRIYFKLGLFLTRDAAHQTVKTASRTGTAILDALGQLPAGQKREKRLQSVKQAFHRIRHQPPAAAIETILTQLDYQRYIDEGSEFSQQKVDILKLLARHHKTIVDFLAHVEWWKTRDEDAFHDPRSNVTLTTLHSSKGLEFDRVIMLDMTDGVIPSKTAIKDTGAAYEEDARLFYVGATRAKHTLVFLTAQNVFGRRLTASRFITRFLRTKAATVSTPAIPYSIQSEGINRYAKKAPPKALAPGTLIRHKMFGNGSVIEATPGGVVSIQFERVGLKKLMLQVCLDSDIIQILT
ncbi:MAG: ATP-dependent helicase [Methanocorpusculum sp.]|nr:ATP-dependent helicase [Methanocorpusculum sp.]